MTTDPRVITELSMIKHELGSLNKNLRFLMDLMREQHEASITWAGNTIRQAGPIQDDEKHGAGNNEDANGTADTESKDHA